MEQDKNTYTIYMHVNKINGKVYIGQTKQDPIKRWDNGRGYLTSPLFYNAIEKYGWQNFDHIILYTGLSEEEANQLEEELIMKYDSTNTSCGYNIKFGGNNHSHSEETKKKIGVSNSISQLGKTWSEEQRRIMSTMFSGKNNPFYGKHHSEETKKLISEHRKGKAAGEEHPFYGQKHTQEALQKMSERRQGKGGKKVKCINTGEIFNCMMDAARWCGLKNSSSIGQVCNKTGKRQTAGKHPITNEPLTWEFIEELE